MKSKINIWILLTFLFILVSCNNKKEEVQVGVGEEKEIIKSETEKTYPVRVQKVKKQSISKTLEYTANLTAFKEIHFAPASPGRIDRIYVEVGDKVAKDQLLVDMDKTQLHQTEVQLENAKTSFKRVDTLHQLGSISEQVYDQTKSQYEVLQTNYSFLKENTRLLSPVNGIVTGKYFENGEMYSGVPNTPAGKAAIVSLMQIKPLKAIVSISQSYYPVIKKGLTAKVTTDIYSSEVYNGTVYKVHPTIDANTRTFQTEIIIENNSEKLKPGMFATIELHIENAESLVVPASAILKQEGTNNRYVFIHKNGTAKQIEVKPGKRFDDMIELKTKRLKEGDELIIEGQANLLNGSKIKIVE